MKSNKSVRIIALIIFTAAVFLRIVSLPNENVDTVGYIRWYTQFAERGFSAIADNFYIYTPPYLYLLWLASLVKEVIPPLLAIKLIPTIFDFLSAFAVYKLVKLKDSQGDMPYLATAGFLLLPTVLVNSSYWGQIDSLYTSFILFCLYFLMTARPLNAMLALGLAFSFKAQAAFLAPFLIVLAFKKLVPWYYFLIPPFIYLIMITPAVLAGRTILNAISIYVVQASTFKAPSMNAPNLYSLFIYPPYYMDWDTVIRAGFTIAAVSVISWIVVYAGKEYELNHKVMVLSMLTCFTLVPFVLPKMHDRYFYPADILRWIRLFRVEKGAV